MKFFTYEQHIKKHTKKENTYNSECAYCVLGDYDGKKYYEKKLEVTTRVTEKFANAGLDIDKETGVWN